MLKVGENMVKGKKQLWFCLDLWDTNGLNSAFLVF